MLKTERLILRTWRESDLEPFAKMNADPEAMRYFPNPLTREESDAFAEKIQKKMENQGYGLWALEVPGEADFIGFVGLNPVPFEEIFTPAVEIGWRLDSAYWRKGYATEAAKRALAFAFEDLGLDELVSFTAVSNEPSQGVMKKIGMHYRQNFEHPALEEGHPLRTHVLYSLKKSELV